MSLNSRTVGQRYIGANIFNMSINSRFAISLCIIIIIFSCSSSSEALQEYHVAVSGNDTQGKGSLQKPWRTIAYAVSKIRGGDIITIHQGSYQENSIGIFPSVSGSAQYPTTIRALEGERVIIYGVRSKASDIYTIGVGASHVLIEGLKIVGFSSIARGNEGGTLYIGGKAGHPCTDVKIKKCELTNSGPKLGGENPSIVVFNGTENCEISNCRVYGSGKCDRAGIKIWRGTSKLLVQGNEVYNLLRRGIDNKHGGRKRRLIIRDNYVHDVGALGIHVNSDNSLVENNVLYNCGEAGIGVWRNEGLPGGSYSILNHNTIVNCGRAGIYLGYGPAEDEGFRNCTVTNNIILNCSNREFAELTINPYGGRTPFNFGHIIDFNCYFNYRYLIVIRNRGSKFSLDQWQIFSGKDKYSIQQDPKLLGEPNNFKDICDFQVSKQFSVSFSTPGDKVIGADIQNMKNCTNRLPPVPSNVRISTP